jgi:type IV secretory pathway VirB10-like protein
MNRLDGDATGPVKVLVSNPLYSHDHQHVIIPEGTVALGEAKKIGAAGFGQQRRMAVVFHRLIMPDGYSVDLDQFHGLDQIGEEGLKDKVNNHYLQIFGTSIALGVVAGASEITQGGGTITTSGSQAFTNGAAGSVSRSAAAILDRFLQIPPTITIREGHRLTRIPAQLCPVSKEILLVSDVRRMCLSRWEYLDGGLAAQVQNISHGATPKRDSDPPPRSGIPSLLGERVDSPRRSKAHYRLGGPLHE